MSGLIVGVYRIVLVDSTRSPCENSCASVLDVDPFRGQDLQKHAALSLSKSSLETYMDVRTSCKIHLFDA